MVDIHIHVHGDGSVSAPASKTSTSRKGKTTRAVAKPKPARTASAWNKYTANPRNQIKFKSGKKKGLLNLKAMGVQYRKKKK